MTTRYNGAETGRQTYLGYKAAQKRTVEKSTYTAPVDPSLTGLSTLEILRRQAERYRAQEAERLTREASGPSTIDRLRALRASR